MAEEYFGSEIVVLFKTLATMIGLSTILYLPTHHDPSSIQIYRNVLVPWSIQIGLFFFLGIGLPYWKNGIFKYSSTASLQRFRTQEITYSSLDRFLWINSTPLDLNDYEIVILKFWTSGCINCQNTQCRVQKIWDKYHKQGLLVIGIHSAKFRQENDVSLVKRSIKQHNITYPVVIDSEENELFKQFGVGGWPTFVAIKPCTERRGNSGEALAMILSRYVGERDLSSLEDFLEDVYGSPDFAIKAAQEASEDTKVNPDTLSYSIKSPSSVDIDNLTGRIFMSDTGNNRILVLNSQGEYLHAIGGPSAGYLDGDNPKFRSPRGLVYDPFSDCIFVCDTGNHSIRCIHMDTKRVSTLCGNGNQGFDLIGGKAGMSQRLNSPYGIVIAPGGNYLLVSMAGIHQIWSIDINTQIAFSISGIGKELNRNGGLLGNGLSACYSQPQGVAIRSPNTLVVADSESSSIRLLNIQTGGSESLIGGDLWFEGNLFLFGDRDGSGKFSRFPNLRPIMQHPSDVAVCPENQNKIFIADTYNNKIKLYDYDKNELSTVSDAFEAPEGICFMDAIHLVVVDRSSLKILDIRNGQVSSILISFDQEDSLDVCRPE